MFQLHIQHTVLLKGALVYFQANLASLFTRKWILQTLLLLILHFMMTERCPRQRSVSFKGAESRDFWPLFFHESNPFGPLINRLKRSKEYMPLSLKPVVLHVFHPSVVTIFSVDSADFLRNHKISVLKRVACNFWRIVFFPDFSPCFVWRGS